MSLLFVDSASDLDLEQIHKLGVEIIYLPYLINDNKFNFNQDFDYDKFYSKYRKGVCVENVELSQEDYINIFEPCLKQGDDVVYIHSSENILNLENLKSARDYLKDKYSNRKLELIDSKNISIGQGLVSYECALLYRKGDTIDEIVDKSFQIKDEYAFYFTSDGVEQLANHDLIDRNSVVGTVLNIKPIFCIDIDGKVQLFDKVSGKKKTVLKLLEICRQKGENIADYPISILYSTDHNSADELASKLKEYFGSDINIIMEQLSPSNSAILGNDVLGISFHVFKKMH